MIFLVLAEAFGYTNVIRGFLDSTMEKVDLLHGVSFASAGSGYDDLTTNLSVRFFLFWGVGSRQEHELTQNFFLFLVCFH